MRGFSILATVTLASCCALAGCRKQQAEPAEAIAPDTAVTEQGENGTVSWAVDTDGKIRGTLKAKDGHPVTKEITGTMIWPGEVADEERDIALDENGGLIASGPPLADDLTGHLVGDCGHIIPLDRPRELLALLMPFLTGGDPADRQAGQAGAAVSAGGCLGSDADQ